MQEKDKHSLAPLVEVMARLRGENGCPWDKEQTHESLRRFLIEETYEVIEAIEAEDPDKLREELGDLLLQVVFHARLAQEQGCFSINEVVQGIASKMVHRHPHVFGGEQLSTSDQVLKQWEEQKRKEKTKQATALDVPRGMPALLRAMRTQEKAARVGFDWPDIAGVWLKMEEEKKEVEECLAVGLGEKLAEEMGDLLFTSVNLCRFLGIEAETALHSAVDRFQERFLFIEEQARAEGREPGDFSLQKMEGWWQEAKRQKNEEKPDQ